MHGCKPCKGCYLPLPGNKKAPYCYGASVCRKASTLLYRECRGEHCSPAAISGNVRFHGSIWNAPLRRRGGFYIRPCNLGQRRTSRASTARPYNALFRQSEAPLKGSHYSASPQRLPFEVRSRAAGEGWPGCHDPTPTSRPPIKTTKSKIEECIRRSSIFCSYFALRVAIESAATAQLICAN